MQKRLRSFSALVLAVLSILLAAPPAAAQIVPAQALRLAAAFAPDAADPGPAHRLEVELLLPEPLVDREMRLVVRRLPEEEPVAAVTLPRQTFRHAFERLPAAALAVELTTPLGSIVRQVDLRQEPDGYLLLEPDFITLWGTVSVDGEEQPSALRLTTVGRGEVKAETDDQGFYEVALVAPLRAIEIDFTGSPLVPHVDFYFPPIDASRQLDFDLPGIRNVIEVVDALSGEPLAGALVHISNRYQERDEEGRSNERGLHRSHPTDEEGIVAWSAFREGTVELTAQADGYRPSPAPVTLTVRDPERRRTLRLPLEPLGETVELTVLLPDGSPAAGAEILLATLSGEMQQVYGATTDAAGRVDVPRQPGGVHLFLRHPAAGSVVRAWPPREGDTAASLALPPAAPPLTVEVRTGSGEAPSPRAHVAAWVGGVRLTGAALFFATGGRPAADANGFWVADRLPAAPFTLLAWEREVLQEALAGQLDTLATEIPYPWPRPAIVRAVR